MSFSERNTSNVSLREVFKDTLERGYIAALMASSAAMGVVFGGMYYFAQHYGEFPDPSVTVRDAFMVAAATTATVAGSVSAFCGGVFLVAYATQKASNYLAKKL